MCPYVNVGSGNDLIVELPTRRTQTWNDNFSNNFATPIAQHDHTGTGKGRLIEKAAIATDGIDGTKILLNNNEYIEAKNATGSAVNMIKVNASDLVEFGISIANFNIINDTYLTGRNNADSANINIAKINTSDKIALGADLANLAMIGNTYIQGRNNADSAYISIAKVNASDYIELGVKTVHNGILELKGDRIEVSNTFTIANNQVAATNVTGATLSAVAGKAFRIEYGIYIDATTDLIEKGSIELSYDGSNWDQSRIYSHDDSLVVFSVAAGNLQYVSGNYSGYSDGTLTYQIIEL